MRFVFPLLIGLLGTAFLVYLGLWQVQRLQWKDSILAEINGRLAAAPVAVPANPDPENDRFLSVTAAGDFVGPELHVLVSAKSMGAAYRVIQAFDTTDGRRLLVDRGVIPTPNKATARPLGSDTIIANVHWPDERDGFTPEDDEVGNIWFARDVVKMSATLGTEPFLLIVAKTDMGGAQVSPLPLDSSGIPNDHLGYAATWFGLAMVWAGMTGFWVWRMARRPSEG
jgi:surfeit locus 1 family protein